MGDWYLSFQQSQRIALDEYVRVLASVTNAAVSTTYGEESGNPRDGFYRGVYLSAPVPGGALNVSLTESSWGPGDTSPTLDFSSSEIRGDVPFATKLAIWKSLREALAPSGFTDTTIAKVPGVIVGDAIAAGETELAERMRAGVDKWWE